MFVPKPIGTFATRNAVDVNVLLVSNVYVVSADSTHHLFDCDHFKECPECGGDLAAESCYHICGMKKKVFLGCPMCGEALSKDHECEKEVPFENVGCQEIVWTKEGIRDQRHERLLVTPYMIRQAFDYYYPDGVKK